ncbi:hypothetical protein [Undibacterium sp. TJN19]|uniref:hypothetical protein n=1 Tax=Undibacterium sp. TJN19 TaxID=3413055 RepID=UPI003BF3164A
MSNRILHHNVAIELSEEMINQVSGGTTGGVDPSSGDHTTIIYSTDVGGDLGCKVDSVEDC